MLTFQLFGMPQILRDGTPVSIDRRKSRAMLYYLVASERPCQREHLLAVFWPETGRVSAQQVLRTTISGLRKVLGDDLLVERDTLSLAPGAQVDARMFEKNLAVIPNDIPKLESILALYRGPFLEGVSLPDASPFDEWLIAERERYQRLAARAFSALSRAYEIDRDYANALASLDRILAFDPLQEDLQREGIRLSYLAGDRPGAIRRYDQLRRLLDEELGVPPMTETRALYDDLINDRLQAPVEPQPVSPPAAVRLRAAPSASPFARLPFSSRSFELHTLAESSFSGRLVLVEGEPGIGKTRLVDQYLSGLPDGIPLKGAARELEQALPYQPVIEALRGLQAQPDWPLLLDGLRQRLPALWLSEVARLVPELGPLLSNQALADEWRLWEGLSQFLLALSAQRPLVLFLDDLHWADPSTLALIGYLARHAAGARLALLAAARPVVSRSPLSNLVTALTREERLLRLPLSRFTPEEVQEIARDLSPGEEDILAGWLFSNSEGNPYILAELVRHARQAGWLAEDGKLDRNAFSNQPIVPQNVYGLIESRLARLSDPARRLLDAAVVAGRDFDFDLTARASALSENAALDALDDLLASGLIYPTGKNNYRFDHTLTMEVAFREVGEARHRLLHRRLAEAMEASRRPGGSEITPGLLAFHYSEGNDLRRAAPYAFQAGQIAAGMAAWREAAVFYEQALASTEGWPRYAILMELGKALLQVGEAARSTEVFRAAAALASAQGRRSNLVAARLMVANSLLPQARFSESIAEVQELIHSGQPADVQQAELAWGTALSLEGADLEGAEEHLQRARSLCLEPSDPETLAQIEFELGSVSAQRGDLPVAIEHYRAALAAVEQLDAPRAMERRVLAENNLAYHLLLLGDPTATEYARVGMELAREKGLLWLQPYLYSTLGEIALARKDYHAAEQNFSIGLELSRQLSIPERVAGLTANLGLLARERGQSALAIHRLSTALAQAERLGTLQLSAQIRIWLAPLLPPEEGLVQLAEARSIAKSSGRKRLLEEEAQVRKQLTGAVQAEHRIS